MLKTDFLHAAEDIPTMLVDRFEDELCRGLTDGEASASSGFNVTCIYIYIELNVLVKNYTCIQSLHIYIFTCGFICLFRGQFAYLNVITRVLEKGCKGVGYIVGYFLGKQLLRYFI